MTHKSMSGVLKASGSLSVGALSLVALMGATAGAQGPTYGVGRTPTAEEIRALDISIGPTGEELPPGRGTSKEGAETYRTKCQGCHGAGGFGGSAPILKSKMGPETDTWQRGRVLPVRAPYAPRMASTRSSLTRIGFRSRRRTISRARRPARGSSP